MRKILIEIHYNRIELRVHEGWYWYIDAHTRKIFKACVGMTSKQLEPVISVFKLSEYRALVVIHKVRKL